MARELFPLEVSKEERDFGFGIAEEPSGIRAVVYELREGLRAVKMQAADGTAEYAICDEQLRPMYAPAKTLDELRARFPGLRP